MRKIARKRACMIISQLINTQGNAVKNQFVIINGDVTTFQSYNSQIVDINIKESTIVFYPNYNFSVTTSKYRNQFLSDILGVSIDTKTVNKMISDGIYNSFVVTLA